MSPVFAVGLGAQKNSEGSPAWHWRAGGDLSSLPGTRWILLPATASCGQMLRNLTHVSAGPRLEVLLQLAVTALPAAQGPADRGMCPGLLAGVAPSRKQAKRSAQRTGVFLFPYCHPESSRSCLAGCQKWPCLMGGASWLLALLQNRTSLEKP